MRSRLVRWLHVVVLLALCALSSSFVYSPGGRYDLAGNEAAFQGILDFWHAKFPTREPWHIRMCDGPSGNRLHMEVPVEIANLYAFPFAEGFLVQRLCSPDPLVRELAKDLLLMSDARPLSEHVGKVSYDGVTYVEYHERLLYMDKSNWARRLGLWKEPESWWRRWLRMVGG